jgi:hypothetical protein
MTFNLKLSGEVIPRSVNPTFIGVTFDQRINFKTHLADIHKRALKRLNIIKILSHKSWKSSTSTLIHIYKTLIGSLFNYSAFCANQALQFWLKKLQVIQNSAIRAIYKLPYDTATEDLLGIAAGLLGIAATGGYP